MTNFSLVLRRHGTPPDDPARLTEHLSWMRAQHDRGAVLMPGPSADGAPPASM